MSERGPDTALAPDGAVVGDTDERGMDEFLTKQLTKEEFCHVVDSLLDRRQSDADRLESTALPSIRATPEANMPVGELEQNTEYRKLVRRILLVNADRDELVSDLSASKSDSQFQQIQSNGENTYDV